MAAKPFKEQLKFISSKMFSFVDYDKEHGSVAVHVKIPEVTGLALIVYIYIFAYGMIHEGNAYKSNAYNRDLLYSVHSS